jgi:hypothetical protein
MWNAYRILKSAKILISSPEWWGKGEYSRHDPTVGHQRYCSLGAIETSTPLRGVAWPAKEVLASCIPWSYDCSIPDFNDSYLTVHKDVMWAFTCAKIKAFLMFWK